MKKRILSIVLAAALIWTAIGGFAGEGVINAFAEKTGPEIKSESAIIYIGGTGEVVWEKNSDAKLEPASVTKLLTALLAVEHLDLDQEIEATAAMEAVPVKMYLQPGEKLKVEDLLYAALLYSANDAANALAITVAGSIEEFAVMMNDKAAELGCTNSNFVNPSGLPAEGQLSTAKDLAIIAEAAFKNDTIKKISGTTEYTIPKTEKYEERNLKNANLFLAGGEYTLSDGTKISAEKYDGVFGGKTGTLNKKYCTMVTGLDVDGIEVFVVVMGVDMPSRFDEVKVLMDYAKANISKYTVFEKGSEFGKVKLKGGSTNKVKAVAAEDGNVNLPEGASASLVTTKAVYTDNLRAPIKKGDKVGVVEIYIADELYGKVDLVAAKDIEEGWFLSKWGISNLQTVIIGGVLLLIIIFVITVLVLRARNKKRRAKARKAKLAAEAKKRLEREEDLRRRDWRF